VLTGDDSLVHSATTAGKIGTEIAFTRSEILSDAHTEFTTLQNELIGDAAEPTTNTKSQERQTDPELGPREVAQNTPVEGLVVEFRHCAYH
jgi:hypothetical protein